MSIPTEIGDDPFALFGDATVTAAPTSTTTPKREVENGVMAFHQGVEAKLLAHLRQHSISTPQHVLTAVDAFCTDEHWMMHVGPLKRSILEDALRTAFANYQKSHPSPSRPFTVLELGTYCGYSSILIATLLRDIIGGGDCFEIKTLEAHKPFSTIAKEIIKLAGLGDVVEVIDVVDVKDGLGLGADFVFVDHDKDLYLADLKVLIEGGCLRSGSVVAADNVVMGRIDDYLSFVKGEAKSEDGFFVSSATHMNFIEYSENERAEGREGFEDGVEVSVVR